ncbi:MAG: TIGR01777 family oxidoreductase [Candidatus Aminicenantes bacterium]|nr:TIGR01777 family oxidoreductase [Candidatus Aminicenantes bacterium]MDH5383111.1 TIGR01777 family oxidoreductase [Candidatus Aminicenantes bacterium]MDH5744402.1 TIGR01777 family oxidoreductase [Candidatus Aminicenantes bacterium]
MIITGGTGFIGRPLSQRLNNKGYEVICLTRNASTAKEKWGNRVKFVDWNGRNAMGWGGYAEGASAIINLAGDNIAAGRWNEKKKQRIIQSRLHAGEAVVKAVKSVKKKPGVVIQASAIGFYGNRGDELLDESASSGEGFLAEVTRKWEASTQDVETEGVRHVVIRTGMVLGADGGALVRLVQPFRFFLGGPVGNGEQWNSWIHLEDVTQSILFLMERSDLSGIFNLTAPQPLKNKDFCHEIGEVLGRPSWLPVPGLFLKLLFGELAKETLLSGQRVCPKRLEDSGYGFIFPEAKKALKDILA